ncbi:MAG TPA: VWA domain-containing protein [Bryobacteraceae bacterium]|nr:VWA domain-containing protein [Bryobacteraceae bacterium]
MLLLLARMTGQEGVTFSSSANLVIIDVSVKDKSGKVIPDLKKGDFTVLEDGKPQQVSVFEFQKLDSDEPLPAVPATKDVRIAAGPSPATAGQAPGSAAAQRGAPKPIIRFQDRRLVAMLFDFSTMGIPEQARAQKAALEFIRKRLRPADLVAIMTAGTGPLKIEQDFTDDRDRLQEVVKKFSIGEANDLAGLSGNGGDDTSGEDTGTAFNADETEFNIFNNDRKLVTLQSAAKLLAAFPEKKALIYFSSGIEQSGTDNQAQLESAVNAAKRANVAFYPIDARGLVATAPAGDASSAGGRGSSAFQGANVSSRARSRDNSQETLSTLASDTGGRLFVDDNDLALGMQKARDDISSYYILGYYSTNGRTDGKYRRVQVKLTSSIQAKLDYKSGYFGEKDFKKFTSSDKENQLEQALMLGDPLTDLSINGELDYFRLARDRYFVPFAVKIPGSEIALAKSKGNAQTELEFIGQLRDEHSKLMGVVRDGIKIKLAEQTAAQLSSRPIAYDTGFVVPPGTYSLKFLARENETGKMGTYETKFTIPDLAPDKPAQLKTSSVVWSSQREPLKSSIASADPRKKIMESDPLVESGQKLIPSITHVFRKDQNLYVYLEVYDPGRDANQKPSVAATLAFYRGKTKSFESQPVRLDSFLPKRGQTLPVKFQTPLAQLAAGRYTCQINLIDETGRKFAFERSDIVVLPASKAPAKPATPTAE